ncbi:MAG: nodulation protein NfeD, partial [Gammaproteobacteria bacterium]|nr:nodulation protein NfeD [Gammaproteobacteria bacterium]
YILYASHVAAMAPATNLGAATPVIIGGLPGINKKNKDAENGEGEKEEKSQGNTLKQKMMNDAEAYIISLAEKHGRNKDWAAKAVREAVSISAEEALRLGVIDLMADNIDELLAELNGREVVLASGPQLLNTSNLRLTHIEKDWRTRLMMVIGDPNIAYMLMLLGIYGLFFELANPGYVLPGVVGGTALLLALYAFQVLPVNYAGLALIVLGISFMVAEAFTPSFGILGMGGLVAFIFGSLILIDEKSLQISLILIGSTALFSFCCILWLVSKLLAIRKKRVRTGKEQMLDAIGEVMDDFSVYGRIRVFGESWSASSTTPVKKGEKVRILAQEGLQLSVEPLKEAK